MQPCGANGMRLSSYGTEGALVVRVEEERIDAAVAIQFKDKMRDIATGGRVILDLTGVLNGYIQLLAVHPDWRSRGIGKQLIESAEQRIFHQSPNVFLCVSSFNEGAKRFYARLGYQPAGELADFIKRGCSEILMRKTRGAWLDYKPDAQSNRPK